MKSEKNGVNLFMFLAKKRRTVCKFKVCNNFGLADKGLDI